MAMKLDVQRSLQLDHKLVDLMAQPLGIRMVEKLVEWKGVLMDMKMAV